MNGSLPLNIILGILIVKALIWSASLSSGTSGGVLAPLLMMGAALGGLEAHFFDHIGIVHLTTAYLGVGFWPMLSFGAILGGTLRAPFTGILFALEVTHDMNMFLPVMIACFAAHAFTVLIMRRSILTEKVSRRGYHLSCEYAVDPLETLLVHDVMRTRLIALPSSDSLEAVRGALKQSHGPQGQQVYPVLDADGKLYGAVSRLDLVKAESGGMPSLATIANQNPAVAYPNESLRAVVYRMAGSGATRFLVVERKDKTKLLGLISLEDLLRARTRNLQEERTRERVLRIRVPFAGKIDRSEEPGVSIQ